MRDHMQTPADPVVAAYWQMRKADHQSDSLLRAGDRKEAATVFSQAMAFQDAMNKASPVSAERSTCASASADSGYAKLTSRHSSGLSGSTL